MIGVYATQVLAGLLVVSWLWRQDVLSAAGLAGRALILGPAAIALQMLVMHALGVPFQLRYVLGVWWLLAVFRRRDLIGLVAASGRATRPVTLVLGGFALLLFGVVLVGGLRSPIYAADVVRNFALMGRVYETFGHLAPDVLNSLSTGGHIEYPPLVALNESLIFRAAGDERGTLVKPFFALAYLAWLLLALEALAGRRPAWLVAPAAVLVLGLTGPALRGLGGMADLRLTATLLLAALEARRLLDGPITRQALIVSAAALACALTKNEGLALALGAAGLLVVVTLRGRLSPGGMAASLAVLAVGAGAWPLFKFVNGIRDKYLAGAAETFSVDQLGRLGTVIERMGGIAVDAWWSPEKTLLLLPAALLVAWALFTRGSRGRVGLWLCALLAHLMLYALVFTFTPRPLDWHLDTAAQRLLSHTSPWLVLMLAEALGVLQPDPPLGYPSEPAPN